MRRVRQVAWGQSGSGMTSAGGASWGAQVRHKGPSGVHGCGVGGRHARQKARGWLSGGATCGGSGAIGAWLDRVAVVFGVTHGKRHRRVDGKRDSWSACTCDSASAAMLATRVIPILALIIFY